MRIPRNQPRRLASANPARLIKSQGSSLRATRCTFSGAGHRVVVGSPLEVAHIIGQWVLAGATTCLKLLLDVFLDELKIVVDEAATTLRRGGLSRHEHTESTLRERFTGHRAVRSRPSRAGRPTTLRLNCAAGIPADKVCQQSSNRTSHASWMLRCSWRIGCFEEAVAESAPAQPTHTGVTQPARLQSAHSLRLPCQRH